MEFSVFLVGQAVIYPAKRLCNGAKTRPIKEGRLHTWQETIYPDCVVSV